MKHRTFFAPFFVLCILTMLLNGCIKPDEFSEIPKITGVNLSSTLVRVGEDFVITIGFEDGDGDLGSDENEVNAFFVDNRVDLGYDSIATTSLAIPDISPEGSVKSISGELFFNMPPACCISSDASAACAVGIADVPSNQIAFDVYIVDRAGNQSNIVRTPPLTIQCN